MWGSVIPWHSYGRIEPFSFLTWMLDFSNSHCTRCQLVSVPVPQIFSQRGSFEGYFPEVQSSWNVNNFPRIFYSNGSIPLCLLHHLLFSQMKKEEGWHGDSHSVPAAHRVSVHSFAMQSGNLCLCSGGMWQTASGGDFFLLELHVPCGLPRKRASLEWLLAHGVGQCSCSLWVWWGSRQTWWMSAWPTEIW